MRGGVVAMDISGSRRGGIIPPPSPPRIAVLTGVLQTWILVKGLAPLLHQPMEMLGMEAINVVASVSMLHAWY
jgi:hypothetical protein